MNEKRKKMIERGTMIEVPEMGTLYAVACKWFTLKTTEQKIMQMDETSAINSIVKCFLDDYSSYTTRDLRVSRAYTPNASTYRQLMRGTNAPNLLRIDWNLDNDKAKQVLDSIVGKEKSQELNSAYLRYFSKKSIERFVNGPEFAYDFFKPYVESINMGGMVMTHNNVRDAYSDTLRAVRSLSTTTQSDAAYNARSNAWGLHRDGINALWEDNKEEWLRAKEHKTYHHEGRNHVWHIHSLLDKAIKAEKYATKHLEQIAEEEKVVEKIGGIEECVDAVQRRAFESWLSRNYEEKEQDRSKKEKLSRLKNVVSYSTWDLIKAPVSKKYNQYTTEDSQELTRHYLKSYGMAVGYLAVIEPDDMVVLLEVLSKSHNSYYNNRNNIIGKVVEHIGWENLPLTSMLLNIEGNNRAEIGTPQRAKDSVGNFITDSDNGYVYETPIPSKESMWEEAELIKQAWIGYFADKSNYLNAVGAAMTVQMKLASASSAMKKKVANSLKQKGLITTIEDDES